MLTIGTSGFSFPDWVGPFYPPGTTRNTMFSYYTRHFSMVELDYTYYRMPNEKTMASLGSRAPKDFQFCVKAYREMTHELPSDSETRAALFSDFSKALRPLADTGRLGCILVQFPWSFRKKAANCSYLEYVRERLPQAPVVIEFRNSEWADAETIALLDRLNLSFCCVDEPRLKGLFPPTAAVAGEIGYVRFHGRNAAKWWKQDFPGERYDYLYSTAELQEWVPKIKQISAGSRNTFILFNNCHAGKAVRNAHMMAEILGLSTGTEVQGGLF
ncbi:MAG TPA: DUF72 domain-containing protein [Firmicutes bacterium]|jgi:uncharacterized protein YecE (DUF72 family)|nr:DUF72 domain-containing protein [Bacillota bacterium]HBG43649.1 DUF72 domain-containing protein [Bacillota bacterium]HBR23351.1 DUF72 domain-containing protein [Bacillota bacterium]HCM17524.1 DUF72 domain-containing protein [Bacillota bacterium]HCX72071.1 DUF72 domain-containing protein [Bacillota bacterium]